MSVKKVWLCGQYKDLNVMGVRVGVANFFLGQSVGIDKTNKFQLKFVF